MYTTREYQEQLDLLVTAQFSIEQARAIMQHVEQQQVKSIGELATKRQVADVELALRTDMEKMETSIRSDMEKMETSIRSDMEKMETSIRSDMEKMELSLKHEISDVKKDLSHRMMMGFIIMFFMSMIGPNLPIIVRIIGNWFK